ncbi:MAG: hypothetical protein K6L76_02925 [Agarilytica sp.]
MPKNKIREALYLHGWDHRTGVKHHLLAKARRVTPSECEPEMYGHIFCPACKSPISRSPRIGNTDSKGRAAYFRHTIPKQLGVHCPIRAPRSKTFETFKDAQTAIDNQSLVIVDSFVQKRPERVQDEDGNEVEPIPEDQAGPLAARAVSATKGETYQLPSVITTVEGICRNFGDNLYKNYLLPGQRYAFMLTSLLHDIRDVQEEDDRPKLYFGVIKYTNVGSDNPRGSSCCAIYFEHHKSFRDFILRSDIDTCNAKRIRYDRNNDGRIVLAYGVVREKGIGLAFERVRWGEFTLLPERYNDLLL